jgi:hypothetical protein
MMRQKKVADKSAVSSYCPCMDHNSQLGAVSQAVTAAPAILMLIKLEIVMKKYTGYWLILFVFVFATGCAGPDKPRHAISIDKFQPVQASFNLRLQLFEISSGIFKNAQDVGEVPLEKAAIQALVDRGYPYEPNLEKARYAVEVYITCFSPLQQRLDKIIDNSLPRIFRNSLFANDILASQVDIFLPSLPSIEKTTESCAANLVLLIKDQDSSDTADSVYAGNTLIHPCPATQNCACFDCRDEISRKLIDFTTVFFYGK